MLSFSLANERTNEQRTAIGVTNEQTSEHCQPRCRGSRGGEKDYAEIAN